MALGTDLPQPMAASTGTVYYVGAGGSDSNTATQAQNSSTPWLTIQGAVSNAAAANVNGGWTLKLKTDKTYSETCYINNFTNLNNVQTIGTDKFVGAVNPCTITADYTTVPGDKGVLAHVTAQIKTYKVGNLRFSYLNAEGDASDHGFMVLGPFGKMTTESISSASQGWFEIDHCEIHNCAATGVFAGGANGAAAFNTEDSNDLHITNCYIHACGRAFTHLKPGYDHGVYHAHGYRIYVANNLILDNPSGNAVQLQPESNGGLVTGNTICGSPYQISVSGDGSVYLPSSNIYGLGAVQRPSSNNKIVNNVLAHAPASLTAAQNPDGLNYGHAIDTFWGGTTGSGNTATNNVMFHNGRGDTTVSNGGLTFSTNTVDDPKFSSDFDELSGYFGSSYLWRASSPAGGATWDGPNHDGVRDCHPQTGSPAAGVALDTFLPTVDYDGVARTALTAGALEVPMVTASTSRVAPGDATVKRVSGTRTVSPNSRIAGLGGGGI